MIFQAFELAIDECSFTGETEPSPKRVEALAKVKDNGITDRHNLAFMGTLVRVGNGKVYAPSALLAHAQLSAQL